LGLEVTISNKTLIFELLFKKNIPTMQSKELKYAVHLDKFPDCPPITYKELHTNAFRWVFNDRLSDSFTPISLIKEPLERIQDNTDLLCKSYGLSLFDTFEQSERRYKALYKRNVI
jgi:hypothetical protein